MIWNLFEVDSFKIDVTVHVNVTKNGQKTRSKLGTGFLTIFRDIYMYCDINFEAINLK